MSSSSSWKGKERERDRIDFDDVYEMQNAIEIKNYDCFWTKHEVAQSTNASNGVMNPSNVSEDGSFSVPFPTFSDLKTGLNHTPGTTRDGNEIVLLNAHVQGIFDVPEHTGDDISTIVGGVYLAMVLDKQPHLAVAKSEDMFVNHSGQFPGMAPKPLLNLDYGDRFEILDDLYIPIEMSAIADPQLTSSVLKMYNISSPSFELSWDGEITSRLKGGVHDHPDVSGEGATFCFENCLHLVGFSAHSTSVFMEAHSRVSFLG